MSKTGKHTIIFTLISVGILSYFGYNYYRNSFITNSNKQSSSDTNNKDDKKTDEDLNGNINHNIITPIPKTKYNETPANEGSNYFEKSPVIAGQQAYIAYPLEIVTSQPPTLIIYNHGSNTAVTTNFNDQFMKDLQYYGEFFASKGYAFAASNQHGKNEGNQASIDDNNNLIKWIQDNYKIAPKVNLIGFSMGGRPTIYFTQQNAEKVNAIAMLAPATCYCTSALYNSLKDIPITIWHGTSDVNVPYSAALEFIQRGKPYDLDITLRTINGVGHFDIDTEYAQEIYDFFVENEPAN